MKFLGCGTSSASVALLDKLPAQLGLPSDCTQWSGQALNQAVANLESACQQLLRFEKLFKEHMAWRVGELFGVTHQVKNWDDTLQYLRQNEAEKELSSKIGFQLSHWKSSKQESARWILSRYYRY